MLSELIDLYSTTYAGTRQAAVLVDRARRQRERLLAYLLASDVMREQGAPPSMPSGANRVGRAYCFTWLITPD